jgi:sugar diacid utilization regulator
MNRAAEERSADRRVIEPLSPSLHALVQALAGDTRSLIRRVVGIVEESIPDYTLSADAALQDQLRDSVTLHLKIWYDCLLAAQPPNDAMLAPVEAAARRRVHQGVSLAGMLRAFRIGSRGFWVGLLEAAGDDDELHHELLFKVSPYLLHHFDVIAQAVAQAYTAEQMQHARWRDRLRLELWNVISGRPDDGEAFRRHCEALGIDAWSPHCAVVLRLGAATEAYPKLENAVDRMLARIAKSCGVPVDGTMRTLHREHLVLWLPVLRGETLVDTDRRLADKSAELVAQGQTAIAAGVGLPGSGARGWRLSMDQAFRALESASAGARAHAHRYSEILFDDVASSSENVQRFLDAMVERLSAEPQLLETLETYLELRQHRKAVSCKLNVHPNTLDHRLQRIETVLGGRFDDVSWLAMLNTALRLRRHGAQARPSAY